MQGFPLKVLISAGKGFILCTALIFASCDNFLEGAGLKRSLDDSIELANTPSVNIEISLRNSAQGTILPEGMYYTAIVHYADGTALMSSIRQK
ncbi:hypothetical protein [uncultured Treponema sp.]|uniref:hypothetical protein n=1 Tax=uncultured Treponema sp. TaxID=162155 RepID=UPI0025D239E5|nr:hypothetical protein [uncultured Treponema sp.]